MKKIYMAKYALIGGLLLAHTIPSNAYAGAGGFGGFVQGFSSSASHADDSKSDSYNAQWDADLDNARLRNENAQLQQKIHQQNMQKYNSQR